MDRTQQVKYIDSATGQQQKGYEDIKYKFFKDNSDTFADNMYQLEAGGKYNGDFVDLWLEKAEDAVIATIDWDGLEQCDYCEAFLEEIDGIRINLHKIFCDDDDCINNYEHNK